MTTTATSVFSFPISDTGEVTYLFPTELPDEAKSLYEPASLDTFTFCPGVDPILSPPGVPVLFMAFLLYADGELWGQIDMTELTANLFSTEGRRLIALVYADAPLTVSGAGACPDGGMTIEMRVSLGAGPNLLEARSVADLGGANLTVFIAPHARPTADACGLVRRESVNLSRGISGLQGGARDGSRSSIALRN